jgi:hypothetical protein
MEEPDGSWRGMEFSPIFCKSDHMDEKEISDADRVDCIRCICKEHNEE